MARRFAHLARATALIGTALALSGPSALAAEPGVVPDLSWGISAGDQERTAAGLTNIGSKWVRIQVEWNQTEKTRGTLDPYMLSRYDSAVAAARGAGQQIIMMAYGSPGWASGASDPNAPPRNPADYASFVERMAQRYADSVVAWEIWNEPNISRFWPPEPSAAAYTSLLKAAYPAVKRGDPNAKVLFGGTSTNDYTFLAAAYASGARGSFDVLATHPYTCAKSPDATATSNGRLTSDTFIAYREMRRTMLDNGDDKPVWITEFGWATATAAACGVTESQQAAYLSRAFASLADDPYVQVALWYSFRNHPWMADQNAMEAQFGLLRTDFSKKPAYDAFKSYATTGISTPPHPKTGPAPRATVPNAAPTVRIPAPASGQVVGQRVAVRAMASDDVGIARVELWVDGVRRRTQTAAPFTFSHSFGRKDRRTRHTLTTKAYDAAGLSAADTVTVKRTFTTTTVVSVARATAPSVAVASQRGAPQRRRATFAARGRVLGAARGVVAVTLQRRGGRRVRFTVRVRPDGRFGTTVHLRPGAWIGWARYLGSAPTRPSRSRRVSFRILARL